MSSLWGTGMAHCVFMHKADSIYDDIPAERYQFPAQYLGRAEPCIGDWIVYLEPSKVRNSPMKPEVPGSPTLASVNSRNTAA